uniref:ZAD domain-containing protein n=1 Tax=Anopheles dirus TaxID=7168 RepID=A0A182NYK9_9DIPT
MSCSPVPICRICLSNDALQVSLFSEYAQRKLLLTKIRVCLPITITHADTLPVTVCSQCIVRLEQFYEYYCKSETSQRILAEGSDNSNIVRRRKHRPESSQQSTVPSRGAPILTTPTMDTEQIEHQMDPILTQSPKIKETSATTRLQTRKTVSPGQTLNVLLNGSKDRNIRRHKW